MANAVQGWKDDKMKERKGEKLKNDCAR